MCEGVQMQVWKGQRSFLDSIFLWRKNQRNWAYHKTRMAIGLLAAECVGATWIQKMKAVLHQATQYLQIIFESNYIEIDDGRFLCLRNQKINDLHHVPWRLSGARCPALQRWRKKFKKMLTWSRQRRSKTGVSESSALRGVWIESI